MKYTEVTFVIAPYSETASDLIAALTADVGFDSFVPTPDGVQGYIPSEQYDEPALRQVLEAFPMPETTVSFTASPMEDKDWNEEWERNFFQPIVVDGRAVVHSTFHTDYPKAEYDIVINPQMAFGTGHHQTTRLMMSYILDADLVGKDVAARAFLLFLPVCVVPVMPMPSTSTNGVPTIPATISLCNMLTRPLVDLLTL